MIAPTLLVLITAVYLAFLFYIAYRGDQKPPGQFSRNQPMIYVLSLAVYCSSWTFFGAVGNAANNGWSFFSIYLGPILVFVFCHPFLQKMITVSKRQKTTTIADFIASRYGKSQFIAALVTLIALIGTIPYISLQLKAVASAFDLLAGRDVVPSARFIFLDTAFYLSIVLALFSILFGTRRIDATEHHRGMINAISFESVVKLLSLLAIAGLALTLLGEFKLSHLQDPSELSKMSIESFNMDQFTPTFITQMILGACAIFCLPRQFHMMAVESRGDEMPLARWSFPVYLLLVSLCVFPITAAGLATFGSAEHADLFILSLPIESGNFGLAMVAFLGGFSAASGMVIVATIALSTMVSNDLFLPLLLKLNKTQRRLDYYPTLLQVRRLTILLLLALAYGYYQIALENKSLYSIGLLSFSAVIQFAPAIVGGLYWRRGHKNGAAIGMLVGFVLWFYCLLMPTMASSGWLPQQFMYSGLFGIDWLSPHALFGINFPDPITHGVFWSLGANILGYWLFSVRAKPSLADRFQAAEYLEGVEARFRYQTVSNQSLKMSDLMELCDRFVGHERTRQLFKEIQGETVADSSEEVNPEQLKKAEQVLASTIGSATAERILDSALRASVNAEQNIVALLDQTSQALKFNREILQVTLDNISQGVSVVDSNLCLVAWNKPYEQLFRYPADFIRVGLPVEDIIRYNIRRGLGMIRENSAEAEVKRRLEYLSSGDSYAFERVWRDGTVIQTLGTRLPDGGYVTSYADITPLKKIQHELERTNETLEAKVELRTQSLSRLNRKLEQATRSKTRFLAAASHDLAQPLSAGKLYLGALLQDLQADKGKQTLAKNALSALQDAESLLKALLDVSKLDSGVMTTKFEAFPISVLLDRLNNEFKLMAAQKNLKLRITASSKWVCSDRNLLHSILQNFLSNAVRYTAGGSVMMGCRFEGNALRIEVRDTGMGIAHKDQIKVFQEFQQLDEHATEGLGLGLAISKRIADLLGHSIGVRSTLGKGSVFYISVPIAEPQQIDDFLDQHEHETPQFLMGKTVLCIDDEPSILEATRAIIERWGGVVTTIQRVKEFDQVCESGQVFDFFIADYHLYDDKVGLDLLQRYRNLHGASVYGVLMTAERAPAIEDQTLMEGFGFVSKPVEPDHLREVLKASILEAEESLRS